jgi:DNA gyrase subunit A
MDAGQIQPRSVEREMRESYLDYAMSVITARALPDVRDGLKPVQRRVLYAMDELALRPTSPYKKSARIVGEVLGKYHPHSDAPVYETEVRLAQDFSMRYPLVDGQGNFGSVDGDPPAAMRYTEARLSAIAEELLADIDKDTVDYYPNFDGSLQQPTVLPGKLPNLLVNGAVGIAVGMATNIPPHHLGEVVDALNLMITRYGKAVDSGLPFDLVWSRVIRGTTEPDLLQASLQSLSRGLMAQVRAEAQKLARRPTDENVAEALLNLVDAQIDVTPEELLQHVKGPDFPTAGLILGDEGIKSAYTTGHGRIVIRAKAHTEELKGNREAIVVSELPYQINKATLIERIADLVRDKRIDGISDMRDESDRQGMRLVIELKRDTNPTAILNQLFKMTALQSSFTINMLALVDGQPRVLTLKQILLQFLNWRRQVLTRRTQFELNKALARAHILEGLKVALDNLDEVIRTIRAARDTDTARTQLMARFQLSDIQSTAILDMQLRRLAALERQKILDELKEVQKIVARLQDLLAHPVKILYLAQEELTGLKTKYGDQRRTRILAGVSGDLSVEDLIPDQDVVVISTMKDYVKRLPGDAYKARVSTRGVPQTTSREDDAIRHLVVANTRETVLFFSNRGRVYAVKCHELPEAQAKARGLPLSTVTGISREEKVTAVVNLRDFQQGGHFVLVTRLGEAKRIRVEEYRTTRAAGVVAMDLEANDELVWVGYTPGDRQILVLTEQGQSIRFKEDDLRSASRVSGGVRAIKLAPGDHVVDANVAEPDADLLLVTARGFGKRVPVGQWPTQGRGGGGIRAIPVTPKTGPVVVSRIVRSGDEVMLASRDGLVVRTTVMTVPPVGRPAQGAMIIQMVQKDQVAAMARLRAAPGDGGGEPVGGGPDDGGGAPVDDGPVDPSSENGGEPSPNGRRTRGSAMLPPAPSAPGSQGSRRGPGAASSAPRAAAAGPTTAPVAGKARPPTASAGRRAAPSNGSAPRGADRSVGGKGPAGRAAAAPRPSAGKAPGTTAPTGSRPYTPSQSKRTNAPARPVAAKRSTVAPAKPSPPKRSTVTARPAAGPPVGRPVGRREAAAQPQLAGWRPLERADDSPPSGRARAR